MKECGDIIKVLCVDDNVDIVKLICMAISAEPDMQVVGELNTAEDLLQQVLQVQPDILLLDLTMPGVNVLNALAEISQQVHNTRTIVFSGYDDQHHIDAAMAAGAWGYISKHVELDTLIDGIRQVARGEVIALR